MSFLFVGMSLNPPHDVEYPDDDPIDVELTLHVPPPPPTVLQAHNSRYMEHSIINWLQKLHEYLFDTEKHPVGTYAAIDRVRANADFDQYYKNRVLLVPPLLEIAHDMENNVIFYINMYNAALLTLLMENIAEGGLDGEQYVKMHHTNSILTSNNMKVIEASVLGKNTKVYEKRLITAVYDLLIDMVMFLEESYIPVNQ